MATKTVRNIETWQAKLGPGGVDGITGASIEGVRLGWCWHNGYYYKPVETPPHVWKFLRARIVPADYLWPFYIDEVFKTIGEVIAAANSDNFTLVSFDESVIEFEVEVSND